ncbi:MAG TPA: isocitrate lyase/phosphoenolpyruvate mutase family protein [Pyrinomonadaceae bacterium]
MTQIEKAKAFHYLHKKGDPIILFNIWDAGSALAVEYAGAKAIATGSHSVAEANGFQDGQDLPLDFALANIERIVKAVNVPVSLDFEGGYATDLETLKMNLHRVIETGAVGINFEDQVVGGEGLYSAEAQSERIASSREVADEAGIPLFINARTDVFLKTYPAEHTREQLEEALSRANAYANAGASGLFAPCLRDPELIRELCNRSPLPVNIMVLPDTPSNSEMAALGVARISYGPGPYRQMLEWLKSVASAVYE